MIQFLQPWLVLLWPLPFMVYWFFPAAKQSQQAALSVPFLEQLQQLYSQYSSTISRKTWKSWILPLLMWTLLVAGACHPIWLGDPLVTPMAGRNILLAVDLSGSMQIPDMSLSGDETSRLDVVKTEARHFIESRKGDRLGLILFGSKAYIQTPLTFDRKTVMNMLNDATIGLAGTQTAIGDALGLGIKQLMQTPAQGRILVLLTDGGNNAGTVLPVEAAKIAKSQGIRIYTVGLGASQIVVPGFLGPQVIHPTSDLDQATLKQIANMTGGLFFRAENGADLSRVYQSINQIEPVQGTSMTYQSRIELYPWLLGVAMGLMLLSVWLPIKRNEEH